MVDNMNRQLEELKRENEMYRLILEALPVNLFVKDVNCKYSITSRMCDMVNGVERGGLKGKSDFDLQSSNEIAQTFYDDDLRIMQTKQGSRSLTPTTYGNKFQYFDIYKEPIIDENNIVRGILGLVIPVGEPMDDSNQEYFEENQAPANAFYGVECAMFDYDIDSGKIFFLKRIDNLCLNTQENEIFENKLAEKTNDIIGVAIKKKFDDFRKNRDRIVMIFDLKDDKDVNHTAVLTLNMISDSRLDYTHAIGILSYLHDDRRLEQEMQISFNFIKDKLTSILSEQYESIIYINHRNNRYLCKGKPIVGLNSEGDMEEMIEFLSKYLHEDDSESLIRFFEDIKSSGIKCNNTIFENRVLCDDVYRWHKCDVNFVESVDCTSEDIIITLKDIDDIVKIRKKDEVRNTNNQLIEVLSSVVESRDLESGNHINRMKNVTKLFLHRVMNEYPEYGLTENSIEIMSAASAMHDIGKVAIPDNILLKPGKLTKEEFEVMKEHTLRGCDIINAASAIQDKEYYKYCYDICRHHHERYDGKGYPDGLCGENISIIAQVVSIADVYDALVSKRCYKDAFEQDKAVSMILSGECGTFNPKLMDVLNEVKSELRKIYFI